jgi:hypothetical protein
MGPDFTFVAFFAEVPNNELQDWFSGDPGGHFPRSHLVDLVPTIDP